MVFRSRHSARARSGSRYDSITTFTCSILLGFLAVACGGDDDAGGPSSPAADSIKIKNENQYTSTSSLNVPVVDTAPTDLHISWSGLDKDLLCHDVDLPSGIRNLTLLRFKETREDVAKRLAGDPISASELYDVYYGHKTGGKSTDAMLSDFTTLAGKNTLNVDAAYKESDITYLLIALSSESLGVGARSMVFLNPTADSVVSDVEIEPGCGILDFKATLQDPLSVPKTGPWPIDWSELEVDGQGNPTSFAGVDQLLVGFFPDRDVQSIEDKIFDIEQDAAPLYELPLTGGTSADLADAHERGNAAHKFPGFEQDGDGTWLFALTCKTCQNPQPIVLTVLEPSDR